MRNASCLLVTIALFACNEVPDAATDTAKDEIADARNSAQSANAEEDVRHFLLQEYPEAAPMQYALAWGDLDGDGSDEAIVHLVTPYFCGTGGCNTLVLTQAGPMWRKVGEISVSRTPVTVLDSSTNGWKDLTVTIGGGGGEAGIALLKFDGEAYPSNPTVSPAQMVDKGGVELLAEQPPLIKLEGEAREN